MFHNPPTRCSCEDSARSSTRFHLIWQWLPAVEPLTRLDWIDSGTCRPPLDVILAVMSRSAGKRQLKVLLLLLAALLVGTSCTDQPDTELARNSGSGWRLLGYERGAQTSSLAAIVTNDRAVDAAWKAGSFSTAKPELDFRNQVGLILSPPVSDDCPDIVFEDLAIGEDQVFGVFDYPATGRACHAIYIPISFFFAVDRAGLPDQFTLAVTETSRCAGCRLEVDLTEEASLEATLWGGPLNVHAEGSAPAEDQVNVVRMVNFEGDVGAFLFQADAWHNPDRRVRELSSLRFVERIEGFVSGCEGHLCTEEVCDVADCDGLQPLGEVCSTSPAPTLEPQVLVVTFDGEDCTMEIRVDPEQ